MDPAATFRPTRPTGPPKRPPAALRPAAALVAAIALTACGSAQAEPPAAASGDPVRACRDGAPGPADSGAAHDQARPVTALVVAPAPGGAQDARRDAIAALGDAAAAGATVIVVAADGSAPTASVPLAGAGKNPTARHQSRCDRVAAAAAAVDAAAAGAQAGAAEGPRDLFGALRTAFDAAASLPSIGDQPEPATIVVAGSALDTATVPFTAEALDQPDAVLRAAADAGMLRDCADWRFVFATPDARDSSAVGAGARETWRRYAEACGGGLVGWVPSYAGVADEPLPPAAAGRPVPEPQQKPAGAGATVHTVSAQALFEINSAELGPGARAALDAAVRDSASASRIVVRGHCDATAAPGDPSFNDRLSTARAAAVAQALRDAGVPPHVPIEAEGAGAREPVAPDTDSTRHLNRRVEVTVHQA